MTGSRFWTALLLSPFAAAALAQTPAPYPSKPIKWVVPYTPGGITDTVTRIVAQKLQEILGQAIVIENKPGANSIVGVDRVAKAPADGYNIVTVIAAHAANATLYAGKLPFDPVKSFTPISLAAIAPLIMTVNNDFPAKDVKDLVSYAKANPGKAYKSSADYARWAAETYVSERATIERLGLLAK
ncbi:MAG: tripartite tricarboxylate transporter substrate-binding protein [Usitatibacter sp.]